MALCFVFPPTRHAVAAERCQSSPWLSSFSAHCHPKLPVERDEKKKRGKINPIGSCSYLLLVRDGGRRGAPCFSTSSSSPSSHDDSKSTAASRWWQRGEKQEDKRANHDAVRQRTRRAAKKRCSCAASFGRNTTFESHLRDWCTGAKNKTKPQNKTKR